MESVSEHWGSIVCVIGVAISAIGLAWAIREARGARSAAEAAEKATKKTREEIGRRLLVVDLERAVDLIQRLKLLHSTDPLGESSRAVSGAEGHDFWNHRPLSDMEPAQRERLVIA